MDLRSHGGGSSGLGSIEGGSGAKITRVIVSAQDRPVGDRGRCSPGCRKRMRPAEPISETLAAMDDLEES
jgi:hypothetical protein